MVWFEIDALFTFKKKWKRVIKGNGLTSSSALVNFAY